MTTSVPETAYNLSHAHGRNIARMNINSIAAVHFLVETSRSGICEMGAIIPHEPIFPSRLGLSANAWLRAYHPQ